MAPQTTNAPYLDAAETFGSGYRIPQFTSAPFLETAATFAPTVTIGELEVGVAVFVGATELTAATDVKFDDPIDGAGSWSFSLANDDAGMPDYDDIVTFHVNGVPRFAGPVEAKTIVTFAPGEEADEMTALKGSGRLVVTQDAIVEPSRGLDALPKEDLRSFSWVSPDFDDTAWGASKRIRRTDVPTALPPHRYSPEWWPDKTSWWVWANRSDVSESSAPGGRCLFRSAPGAITLAADSALRLFAALDNGQRGRVWFDGAGVIDTDADASAYTVGKFVDIPEATAGEHVIAASVLNTGKGGGLNWSLWTVDEEGLLDELVAHSDSSTTLCLPYPFPDNPPTVTAGWAIRQIVEEHEATTTDLGQTLDWSLDFTDTLDSDGEPWTPVAEITVEVGRSLLEMLESLSDWLIDAHMAPGANVIRAWNWGTRGGTPGVTITATEDPATSETEGLTHDGRRVRANRFLIPYRGGIAEVFDQDSIDATGVVRSRLLDLGIIDTEDTAKGIGRREMERRKDPSYGHTLTLAAASSNPYDDFDNGDYINHLDETGVSGPQRVRSIGVTPDADDSEKLTWVIQTNDEHKETDLRHENWLKRKAPGVLSGGARVSTRSGDALPSAVRVATRVVAEFSFQDPTDGIITGKRPADSSGNLIEIYVEVSTEDDSAPTTASTVKVWQYVHGTLAPTLVGTVTVAAGDFVGELDLSAAKTYRNIYKYRAEVTTVGSGVNGVDVQLRAI